MPELEPPSKSYPSLWPSLLIAAILAIAIPVIHFFVSDPIGLTLIFLPIYITLAFAFIWPMVVAGQGPIPGPWLQRHTVALVLFLTATGSSALWIVTESRHATKAEAEEQQKPQNLRAAQDIISSKGLFAFTEPLKPGEEDALIRLSRGAS
jgi:hypothetical protein